MRVATVLVVGALAGCASSGPVPIGKDTYMITKQSAGGAFVSPGSIKVEIIREAQAFCGSTGKVFQIANSNERPAQNSLPSAEIQFMCLNEGDRDIQRPKMSRMPDTIIEVRK